MSRMRGAPPQPDGGRRQSVDVDAAGRPAARAAAVPDGMARPDVTGAERRTKRAVAASASRLPGRSRRRPVEHRRAERPRVAVAAEAPLGAWANLSLFPCGAPSPRLVERPNPTKTGPLTRGVRHRDPFDPGPGEVRIARKAHWLYEGWRGY